MMKYNKYQDLFIRDFVGAFRRYNTSCYAISIVGLDKFFEVEVECVNTLLGQLRLCGFVVECSRGSDSSQSLEVSCCDTKTGSSFNTKYQIQSITSLIELSSKTSIPLSCLVIMKVIAMVIGKLKILYKAIALDLDDTLWKGTLSEDGIEKIQENMLSKDGYPFISFMKFIKLLAEELGIFIAICSRNDNEAVSAAIDFLDESVFPLKNQIDCIVANNNNKSDNLLLIAQQLSILPGAIVFIDDNKIVRDEVKASLPDVCIPEWNNHEELISSIITGCMFDRNEFSAKSKNRRKQYRMILAERKKNTLPSFPIAAFDDHDHSNAIELYTKSNQFNFSQRNNCFEQGAESIYFELLRDSGESLGVCSVVTFVTTPDTLTIINWAMSCRFFEIGVEESVLLFIANKAGLRKVSIQFNDSGLNQKAKGIMEKYPELFVITDQSGVLEILFTPDNKSSLNSNTNLIIR